METVKRLVVFDLDGTLAESKQAIDDEMARLLAQLLEVRPVAVISGGDWSQFERQLLGHLPVPARLENLLLMPTSGTKFYRFDGGWKQIYVELFAPSERQRIFSAFDQAIVEAGLADEPSWGDRIEDRGSQITYSGLGQHAPLVEKLRWDSDLRKRTRLKSILELLLPGVAVRIGGSTSIDITRLGIDKAYGIRKLVEETGFGIDEMLFIGDALYPGGNDAPVRDFGVATIAVLNTGETKLVIVTVLSMFGVSDLSQPA